MKRKSLERATDVWKTQFTKSLQPFLLKGDYRGGLPIAKAALKKFPHEFVVRFNYAKLLGDWADELPPARKKKMKAEAIAVLRPLLRSLSGMAPLERFGVSLNYYYQSEAWQPMYSFGKRFARFHKQKSLYAQGLAATLLAFDELQAGRAIRAAAWSSRAIQAWKKYDFKNEKYYFPHYCFAKALAVSATAHAAKGESRNALALRNEARLRLKTAARLGRRPVTDWEFSDVMVLLKD